MKLWKMLTALSLTGIAAACGPGSGAEDAAASPSGGVRSSEAAAEAIEPAILPSPYEEALRIAAEDDALAREDARLYEERKASMAGYADCMAQAQTLSNVEVRKRIEEACGRRAEAPR
jgi:hypothetical protein